MKSVADPIVLTDLDNEILLQNRRAEELFSGSANAGRGKRRALKMNDLLFSAYLSSATVSSSEVIKRHHARRPDRGFRHSLRSDLDSRGETRAASRWVWFRFSAT